MSSEKNKSIISTDENTEVDFVKNRIIDKLGDGPKKTKIIGGQVYKFGTMLTDRYTGACAAQAAFFLLISIVPLVSLILVGATYLPFSYDDIIDTVMKFIPMDFKTYVVGIVKELYLGKEHKVIPIAIVAMIWSASKGIYALMDGFNSMFQIRDKYTPIKSRAISLVYTIIFVALFAIVMSVYVLVIHNYKVYVHSMFEFGSLQRKVYVIAKYLFGWVLFYGFILSLYVVLPGGFGFPKTSEEKINFRTRVKQQMAGAEFCSVAWIVITQLLIAYVKFFPNFSIMYGSLAGIVIIMLWLYFCMYFLFVGAIMNYVLAKGYLTRVKKMLQ